MKSSYFISHFSRLGITQTSLALHSAHRISSIVVLVCCLPLFLSCMKGYLWVTWRGPNLVSNEAQTIRYVPHTTKCNPEIQRMYYGPSRNETEDKLVGEGEDGVFKGEWVSARVENKQVLISFEKNQTEKRRYVRVYISDGVTPGGHSFDITQYPYVE